MKTRGITWALFGVALLFASITSCAGPNGTGIHKESPGGNYGVYYEIFPGSFRDSDGDGLGDLRGIIQKLDYLNDGNPGSNKSLHVDGLWLTPIHPSPSYHKYDVTDYYAIDPAFGTLDDFEELVAMCGKRGVKVIIDLVLNHTSIEHPWFLAARQGDPTYMAYYNIADSKLSSKYYALGFDGTYYEGEFWEGMPDLNFDNPDVRREIEAIADFWISRGVAGFRLDAALHFYQDRQKSAEALKWFTDYCKSKKSDVYLVAEVWDSPGQLLNFSESGISSLFNFQYSQESGLISKAVSTANGASISTATINWNRILKERNSAAIDVPFLSNHDQNRSAGYFNQDVTKEKMAAALYLFMPGNPFIYYGEEIGMTGSGKDENKRGPMIWSVKNSVGIPRGPSGMDQRWDAAAGVEELLKDPSSLTRFYINALRLKHQYPLTFYGTPEELAAGDRAVAAFTVRDETSALAVLHNLSREEKIIDVPDAKKLSGFLSAENRKVHPSIKGTVLRLPPYSTAIVELTP
jgi:glycosidase